MPANNISEKINLFDTLRGFHGIHTPIELWDCLAHKTLTPTEGFLVLAVMSFTNMRGEGCWASNTMLADCLGVQPRMVRYMLARLKTIKIIKDIRPRPLKYKRLIEVIWYPAKKLQARKKLPPPDEPKYSKINKKYYDQANQLHAIVVNTFGIKRKWREKNWALEFMRMEKDYPEYDVQEILTWFCDQAETHKELGLPTIQSVKHFRTPKIFMWVYDKMIKFEDDLIHNRLPKNMR